MAIDVVVLIPAYRPEETMLDLLQTLSEQELYKEILVVDDGSGEEYTSLFKAAEKISGVSLLCHEQNGGKGKALKTGLAAIMERYPGAGVVSADCDGQHAPQDIARVAQALMDAPDHFIVGGRAFSGEVPLRSRIGNWIMRQSFFLSTRVKLHDTQTGLRGIPPRDIEREAAIEGDRYEYEMNVLLSLPGARIPIREIPIQTIYLNQNAGSHFHAIRDAGRVFGRMLAFASSSLISFGIDYGLYIFLGLFSLPTWADYAIARLASSAVNFTLNRKMVFRSKGSLGMQLLKYYLLAGSLLAVGTLAVGGLEKIGLNRYWAKILTDSVLFIVSFFAQRHIIFKDEQKNIGA